MQLLPCAFLVSRHGIFKIHLSQCVFLVFWRCVFFAYVWCICDAIFAKKCIFLRVWHLCLAQAYFFTPWAPASCAGVFILRVCGNRTCTFTAGVFSYPHIVHFFWKVHFWTAPVETKIRFLLQVYFGSTCFPKVKRTLKCFKIVRVSTGFGKFTAKVPCKHFGEESICSIMFFFPIRVHLFLSAPSSYAVQPCAHRSLRLGSCSARSSARSSALQRVSVETNKDLPIWTRGHYPTRNQMYLFIYVFFRCWNGVFSMYMSCTFNIFVYLCIS